MVILLPVSRVVDLWIRHSVHAFNCRTLLNRRLSTDIHKD